MMRSLWTAASGMMSQQTSVDTIANNLANVNTVGYKQEQTQFKSLLYQNLQAKTTSANGENKPVGAQVGLGSRVSAVTSIYTQGALNATDSTTDFAINGDGFFAVRNTNTDETVYTRNGHFTWATATEGVMLSTSEGYPVLLSLIHILMQLPQVIRKKALRHSRLKMFMASKLKMKLLAILIRISEL